MLSLTTDIIINIIKFLDYNYSIVLIDLLKNNNTELLYYNDEIIYNLIYDFKFKKYLDDYNISNLYNCIINSSFNLLEVDNNLNKLFNITFHNMLDYEINYNINDDNISLDKILNTINILNIFINIVQDVNSGFITDNPYHYIHIYITDKLVNYLTDVNLHNYKITNIKHCKKNHHKFRFEIYSYSWNKTDISIYYLYQLYLISINILNIDILKPIIVNNKYKKETRELLKRIKVFYTNDVNNTLGNNLK